jgi:acyl-CoA synthetase (NDP forming)
MNSTCEGSGWYSPKELDKIMEYLRQVHKEHDIEAVTIAKETGYPLAVKVFSPSISHKSDVGGVILNVSSKMELEKAYWTILENLNQRTPGAKFSGIYLQKMAQLDMEVIIGIKRDDQFGPVILFGMGGKYVEFLEDTSLRLAPITKDEAAEMISEVRGAAILQGVRGEKPFDVLAIIDSLLRLSQLAVQYPAIKEIDVNPLIVNHEGMGVVVVDARIIIE